ncbi:hypothetical protein FGO68_gene15196 [Halteria grandinella]|uniref:Uncharacterized protein n=1 Tax=Halteria grandinella TaxID=5974 RepID=A0A8J8NXS1_HALGN|nr:hypothetical protein FGO68_gene15196 [Halteria grandinella]
MIDSRVVNESEKQLANDLFGVQPFKSQSDTQVYKQKRSKESIHASESGKMDSGIREFNSQDLQIGRKRESGHTQRMSFTSRQCSEEEYKKFTKKQLQINNKRGRHDQIMADIQKERMRSVGRKTSALENEIFKEDNKNGADQNEPNLNSPKFGNTAINAKQHKQFSESERVINANQNLLKKSRTFRIKKKIRFIIEKMIREQQNSIEFSQRARYLLNDFMSSITILILVGIGLIFVKQLQSRISFINNLPLLIISLLPIKSVVQDAFKIIKVSSMNRQFVHQIKHQYAHFRVQFATQFLHIDEEEGQQLCQFNEELQIMDLYLDQKHYKEIVSIVKHTLCSFSHICALLMLYLNEVLFKSEYDYLIASGLVICGFIQKFLWCAHIKEEFQTSAAIVSFQTIYNSDRPLMEVGLASLYVVLILELNQTYFTKIGAGLMRCGLQMSFKCSWLCSQFIHW